MRQPWQLPTRQPDAAGTPFASARSSSVGQLLSQVALTPERENRTALGAVARCRRAPRRGRAEALAADQLLGNARRAQPGGQPVEERRRPAEVVLGVARDAERGERVRVDAALGVVVAAEHVARLGPAVEHVQAPVREPPDQLADLLAERVLAAVAGAVDPPDVALRPLGRERVQHREHGRRADAGAQQRDGAAAGAVEHERPARARQLEHVAGLDGRVQVAAEHAPSRLTLMRWRRGSAPAESE